VALFLLQHRHEASECQAAFAAWAGFESPLRHAPVLSTCLSDEHRLWWRVEAIERFHALAQLPPFVANRTEAIGVREFRVP
jgi:hypothetical protein